VYACTHAREDATAGELHWCFVSVFCVDSCIYIWMPEVQDWLRAACSINSASRVFGGYLCHGILAQQCSEPSCSRVSGHKSLLALMLCPAGKKWLHTGIVRLPMAQPQHLAAVLQAVLSLHQQQQQQPWQRLPWQQQHEQQQQQPAPMGLTESELSRNTFKPAAVITTATAATAAGAEAAPPAAAAGSSAGAHTGSSTSSSVWRLLTRTTSANSSSSSAAATSQASTAAPQPSVATAARRLGALGMLLSQTGGMHTLSNSTLQNLAPGQQQQQQEAAFRAQLDVPGLPVPQHDCCLVEGGWLPGIWLCLQVSVHFPAIHATGGAGAMLLCISLTLPNIAVHSWCYFVCVPDRMHW